MENSPTYGVSFIAAAPTAHVALTEALAAFQAEANGLLAAAGYPGLTAQVSACILASGFNYQVSAQNPTCVFSTNLSFGMATTPEKALDEFSARLVPALALNASLAEMKEAA
jgi:hypothetical protein